MRLWSIKLEYLDAKGLVALWREALLAKKVLEKKTIGYKNHPQLIRFRSSENALKAINTYLYYIYNEARKRNYSFDKSKIEFDLIDEKMKIPVTQGQLDYELLLLKNKVEKRSLKDFERINKIKNAEPNELFKSIDGGVEKWERLKISIK